MDRRQKNIADAAAALDKALDRRERLVAALVRNENTIRKLRKRGSRAQRAYVASIEDPSSVSVGGDLKFRHERLRTDGEFNDPLPWESKQTKQRRPS